MPNLTPLEDVIRILDLHPLTGEGGMWAQGHLSDEIIPAGQFEGRDTDRPLYGTIYYLITRESFSCMHILVTDEVWYHHMGPAAKLFLIYPDGKCEVKLLGQDLVNGELPQITVPRGVWQGCLMGESGLVSDGEIYTLVSTSMAPAYQASDFRAGVYEELRPLVTDEYEDILRRLTGDPQYI